MKMRWKSVRSYWRNLFPEPVTWKGWQQEYSGSEKENDRKQRGGARVEDKETKETWICKRKQNRDGSGKQTKIKIKRYDWLDRIWLICGILCLLYYGAGGSPEVLVFLHCGSGWRQGSHLQEWGSWGNRLHQNGRVWFRSRLRKNFYRTVCAGFLLCGSDRRDCGSWDVCKGKARS